MKKTIIAIMLFIATGSISVMARGGGGNFQPPTPEERVKRAMFKIDSAFKPDVDKTKTIDGLFLEYYKQQDKVREEVMAGGGGGGGGQVIQEKMKPFTDELDKKLKPILGDDNFKIWKEQIEPALRRRGGGRPN